MAKKNKKKAAAFGAKADFIRANSHLDVPALMALAKKEGMVVSKSQVYHIRAQVSKKRPAKAVKAKESFDDALARNIRRLGNGDAGASNGSAAGSAGHETKLRSLIAELGLQRSRAVFASVEQAFSAS